MNFFFLLCIFERIVNTEEKRQVRTSIWRCLGCGVGAHTVTRMRKGRKWQTNCLLGIRVSHTSFPHRQHPGDLYIGEKFRWEVYIRTLEIGSYNYLRQEKERRKERRKKGRKKRKNQGKKEERKDSNWRQSLQKP